MDPFIFEKTLKTTSALILAAGEASRMGYAKQTLLWRDKTLLAHAVAAVRTAGVPQISVVLGAHLSQVKAEAEDLGISTVINDQWKQGIGTSIRKGVSFVLSNAPKTKSILILLADQPKINSDCIQKLLHRSYVSPDHIIASRYRETLGVPALFPRNFFEQLAKISDHSGAKSILLQNSALVVPVDLPQGAEDIDTPLDYANLCQQDTMEDVKNNSAAVNPIKSTDSEAQFQRPLK